MPWTEFYCDYSAGSNLNGGSISTGGDPQSAPYPITYTGGSWNQTTRVFTVASGNPAADGVTVGDYASVYADGAAAPTGFVGKVVARDSTTITISSSISAGTAPATGSNITMKVGGAWKGPNGSDKFPFGFVVTGLATATDQNPRVNFKNNAVYYPSVNLTPSNSGPIRWQGYTSAPGDGGKATFDFSTNAVVYMTVSQPYNSFVDLVFRGASTSGTSTGVSVTGSTNQFTRVVCQGARGHGFSSANSANVFEECEAYGCCTAGSSYAGFIISSISDWVRCIAHDNGGSGFSVAGASAAARGCIADTNASHGFLIESGSGRFLMAACDAYNNSGDGLRMASTGTFAVVVESCNFVKNTGWGVNVTAGSRIGFLRKCAFGSGNQANGSGTTTGLRNIDEVGSITITADQTPWVDPANGDFRINHASCKGAGAGSFTQTQAGYSGTVGYPDIGAAQHQDTGGGGGAAGPWGTIR